MLWVSFVVLPVIAYCSTIAGGSGVAIRSRCVRLESEAAMHRITTLPQPGSCLEHCNNALSSLEPESYIFTLPFLFAVWYACIRAVVSLTAVAYSFRVTFLKGVGQLKQLGEILGATTIDIQFSRYPKAWSHVLV